MNYYKAKQREETKRWDYTCMNDGHTWPVGNCVSDGGHDTLEEACECYKQYLLDNRLTFSRMRDQQLRCEATECGKFTDGVAVVGHRHFTVCDDHRNRESVEPLFEVGESASSY